MSAVTLLRHLMTTIDRRGWDKLDAFLHPDFSCFYVHTGESFNREQWVRLNADYPGFDRLRLEQITGDTVTAACRSHVTATGESGLIHFECATFIDLADGLISRMTEVWTDVDQQPPAASRPDPSG